ncbi:MAG: ribonuclease HI [Clostridia bacterium]
MNTKKLADAPCIQIYTDGACSNNPGPGGWAYVLMQNNQTEVNCGGQLNTTNNQMELMGVIEALKNIKTPSKINIFCDSAYVVNSFLNNWHAKWVANGWLNAEKKPVLNKTLWEELLKLSEKHFITWTKVKGHSSNELNNKCDYFARFAINCVKKGIALNKEIIKEECKKYKN